MQYMIYRLTVTGQSTSSMLMLVAALSLLLAARAEELYWASPQAETRQMMYAPENLPDGFEENRVLPIVLTDG